MPKNQFSFYATRDDLVEILKLVASRTSFCIVSTNDIQEESPCVFKSVSDLSDISNAVYGDLNREKTYLLIAPDAKPKMRQVEQRGGGIKYILDQLSHPESVVLKPGGVFENFECIIAGQIGTVSDDEWSMNLYKELFSEVKKRFKKIKSFYVGEVSEKKLNDGVRLTTNIRSPTEYDLQRSANRVRLDN